MSITRYYDQTIKIVTVTQPDDFSTAQPTESCSTAAAAVNPVSGLQRIAGGGNEVFIDYKAFMSSTVTITENNRVIWSGSTLNAVFVKNTFSRGHHKLVFLNKDIR